MNASDDDNDERCGEMSLAGPCRIALASHPHSTCIEIELHKRKSLLRFSSRLSFVYLGWLMGSYPATPNPLETRMDKGFAKVAEPIVAHHCGTP